MENKTLIAYKGFDKDMKCRDFQYEVGKEYETDKAKACESGFHACENPFDVLNYYNDIEGKYCIVEQSGEIDKGDRKQASTKIKIKAEIGFVGLFKAGIEWLKTVTKPCDMAENNSGDYARIGSSGYSARIGSSGYSAQIGSSGDSARIGSSGNSAQIGSSGNSAQIGSSGNSARIGSSGDSAQIGSSGYSAQIGSSGYSAQIGSSGNSARIGSSGYSAQIGSSGNYARIDSTGNDSVICCAGFESIVKAKKGSWITLSEWKYCEEKQRNIPICVKTEYVDGERIKEDTWYKLINGEFTEYE